MYTNKKSSKNHIHLLSKTTIALLVTATAAAVYFLTPTSTSLEEKIAKAQSPEVSLAYLNELEKVHPNDPMLPYLRAKIYYDKGNYNEVMELLAPQIKEDPKKRSADTYILYIKTKIALAGSINNQSEEATLNEVRAEIKAFHVKDLNDEQLRELSDIALSMGMPDTAYEYLYKVKRIDSKTRKRLYNLALQAGNFKAATDYMYTEYMQDESLEKADELFALYLQSANASLYKEFLEKYDGTFKENPVFIKKEIETANRLGLYDDAEKLLIKLCSLERNEDNLKQLAKVMINKGNLKDAALIYDELFKNNQKKEYLDSLHEIYTWMGDIEGCQKISLQMLDYDATADDAKKGISESRALADLINISVFYDYMYEKSMIDNSDIDDFVDTQEKTYGTPKTLEKLNNLAQKNTKNAKLYSHILRLNAYLNDYENTIKSYNKLSKLRALKTNEAKYAANAFIMSGDDDSALRALINAEDWLNQADDDYLNEVASLAWSCSDRELSAKVQTMLMEKDSENVNSYYLVKSIDKISKDNADKLLKLYLKNKDEVLLYELLNYGSTEDEAFLKKTLDSIKKFDVYNSIGILPYRAALLVKEKKYSQAKVLYEKMLSINPSSIEAIDGLCNVALACNNTQEAKRLYKKYKHLFAANPQTYSLAANLADTVGLKKDALTWYKLALTTNSDNDTVTLIAIASLLDETGDSTRAYKIRKYLAKKKIQELLALDDSKLTFSSLVHSFTSPVAAKKILKAQMKQKEVPKNVASAYVSDLLNENHVLAAQYIRANKTISAMSKTDYEELLYALKTKDLKKIEYYVEKGSGIEDPLRYDGMKELGHNLDAYNFAKKRITKNSKQTDAALRSLAASDKAQQNHSLQALYTTVARWGLKKSELNYHGPYGYGEYMLSAVYQKSKTPSGFTRKSIESEKRLIASISFDKKDFSLGISADLADGAGKQRNGILVSAMYRFFERYSIEAKGGINQHSAVSHAMSVLGKDNYAGLELTMTPYGRETFIISGTTHSYKTRFNESLGSGFDIEATVISPIFLNDPFVNLYLSGVYQKNTLKDNPLYKTNVYNGPTIEITDELTGDFNYVYNTITSESFISRRYKRLALGTNIGHGTVQVPGHNMPSFRYMIDFSTGYNFTEKKIDASVQFGAGTNVFNANDELSVKTGFQTADRQGDRAFSVSVGYYMEF